MENILTLTGLLILEYRGHVMQQETDKSGTDFGKKLAALQLYQLELAVEKRVIAGIRQRQDAIPGLKQDPLRYTATLGGGDMTVGCCECCLKGAWTQIRTTTKCNLDCDFCYYYGEQDSPDREMVPPGYYMLGGSMMLYTETDIKLFFQAQGKEIKGVAWLCSEPLLEMEKLLPLMSYLHREGYYQWLYTNGLLATDEVLTALADAGLDEIRFNLAATNVSDKVLGHMADARTKFKTVCVESPVFTQFCDTFITKRKEIIATGVDHIHLAELQLFKETADNFADEGPIYRYKKGYVSPIKSRQLTYDIFDVAAREEWRDVVLHDCSNEVKFYRGVYNYNGSFGHVNYFCNMELPPSFYRDAMMSDLPLPKS